MADARFLLNAPGDRADQGNSAVVERRELEVRIVTMASDGVNDAPALAAEVRIAIGTGTDLDIESAGVALPKGT